MREIKFRAWYQNELVGYLRFEIYPDSAGEHLSIRWAEDIGVWEQCWPPGSKGTPNIDTIEQFTGLKDKNGKELDWWEGDLFRFAGSKVVRQLIYSQGRFVFVLPNGLECACKDTLSWGELPIKIGNIHQNPELTEAQNRN